MKKYHIDNKGNPGLCRARKKCPYGDLETEHFPSIQEARDSFEKLFKDKNLVTLSDPMSVLPEVHRDIFNTSDAFYNVSGNVSQEALEALGSFHYYRKLINMEFQDSQILNQKIADAKGIFLKSPGGEDYRGWKYNQANEEATILPEIPLGSKDSLPSDFAKEGDVREDLVDENVLASYIQDSLKFYGQLTPSEHNAITYWTSCGSTVAATSLYGTDNPWHIQSHNTSGKDYFNVEKYLKTIDGALDRAELEEPVILYRGLNLEILGEDIETESFGKKKDKPFTDKWISENYEIGKEITFKIPQSTTLSSQRALGFSAANIVYEFKAHRAAAVGVASAWGASETEYLVPRDTAYKVVSIQRNAKYLRKRAKRENEITEGVIVIQLEQI